jgi:type VI secretion system protein ImpL
VFLSSTAALWILFALIVLMLALLGFILYLAVQRGPVKGSNSQANAVRTVSTDGFKSSFRQAVELIEANIVARSERYSIPWVLLLNEGEDSQSLPIEQAGVAAALSPEAISIASGQAFSWHFFDRGIVLDVLGEFLGSPDDEAAADRPWDELLGLCQKYRPQRPIDSIVVTIPVELLVDDTHEARQELERRARLAHRRLWLAQNRFAMRFAVYVVVTRTDKLRGFASFARSLPESQRASMLGWSSPYDLATVYQSDWVAQALDTVGQSISDAQAELFASDTVVNDADALYLLPLEIERIRANLQQYVDELLRPSAYHEPFYLRGIYLTGDSGPLAQQREQEHRESDNTNAVSADEQDAFSSILLQEPAFLKDLFERKIFAEYGLARPVRAGLLSQGRVVRAMKWATISIAAVWGVGLIVSDIRINGKVQAMTATLNQIAHDRADLAAKQARGDTMPPEWYRQKSQTLIATMERSDEQGLWAVFMPGSWPAFNDLPGRLQREYGRVFSEIAVATLDHELQQKISALTGVTHVAQAGTVSASDCSAYTGASGQAATHPTLTVEETQEFQLLSQFLSGSEHLETALDTFKKLRQTGRAEPDEFRNLIHYTLGVELPGEYQRSLRYFRESLRGNPGTSDILSQSQNLLRCAYVKTADRLYQRLYEHNDLITVDGDIATLRHSLFERTTDDAALDDRQTLAGYRTLLDKLDEVESLINSAHGGWVHEKTVNLGPAYDALLQRVSHLSALGPDMVDRTTRLADVDFGLFAVQLGVAVTDNPNSTVQWSDKDKRYALKPDYIALRAGLTALMAQSFMAPGNGKTLDGIHASQGGYDWDLKLLDQALALQDARHKYIDDSLPLLPVATRESVLTFVDRRFAEHVVGLVADAQSTPFGTSGDASDLQTESDPSLLNFDAARPRLVRVLGFLDDLGATQERRQLVDIVATDASTRLRVIDDALRRTEPFSVRDGNFSWWQGDRNPVLVGYGVSDPVGLTQYLAQQFSHIEALSQDAAPLVALLQGTGQHGDQTSLIVQRWTSIAHELERYRTKNPNSTLAQLEQFILSMGSDLDRHNCIDRLAGHASTTRSGDYFSDRRNQLFAKLQTRCYELKTDEGRQAWTTVADTFNRSLAGRFPFAQITEKEAQAAELDDIVSFLKVYDKSASSLGADINLPFGSPSSGVRRFMDEMGRVRPFLAPLFPADDAASSGYDVTVTFRVNQAAEIEGNQIADWTLTIGDQSIQQRDGAKALNWMPGQSISLALRLAKDAPIEPLADAHQTAMRVDGKSVIYNFTDPWALLTFIEHHRDAEANSHGDGRSQTLRLEFPTHAVGADGKILPAQATATARVFIRLSLKPAGKHTSLVWPSFPNKAPAW